ncbi:cytochrome P450 [Flagelloscypha sp. PMI_526]|nr:cytochrome P450 [Flagelloscypha sp. PMI_526]
MDPAQILGLFVITIFTLYVVRRYIDIHYNLSSIPTVGHSGFFSTYLGIFLYLKNANAMLDEGYRKYPGMVFKLYTSAGWTLFASGHARLADAKGASEDELSFLQGANYALMAEYTMCPEVVYDVYHVSAIRGHLTRNIATIFPEMRDETVQSIADNIPLSDDWTEIPGLDTMMKVISRISNRVIVGLPLCRNQEFLDINIHYTVQAVASSLVIRMFPEILRGFAAKVFSRANWCYKRVRKLVEPMLQERLDSDAQFGTKYAGRSNDYISWLLEIAKGSQRTIRDLTLRILLTNFAAIHTSTMSVTHALFDLAANPQYISELRDEIEAITREHGWSKASLQKMSKLDSMMRESQRLWGLGAATSSRLAMKDFTFSNGQIIPAGYIISCKTCPFNSHLECYENPREFRPFRFIQEQGTDGPTPQFSTPGRFFASTEIKGILAHLLVTYDFATKDGQRPANFELGNVLAPDGKAKLRFRKRRY